jgi:hypothetical protein
MQNRVFPCSPDAQRLAEWTDSHNGWLRPSVKLPLRSPGWWCIRWGRVRAIRAAIASGAYNLETRLADLRDDPPSDLAY